ncbi:hypothetical protein Hanom_Chr04g00360281 [Helianthus anomalus]
MQNSYLIHDRKRLSSSLVCAYNVYMCKPEGKSKIALILMLFYKFRENNVKNAGRLIMHHVVALIAERQRGTCTNRSLSRLLSVMCLRFKA